MSFLSLTNLSKMYGSNFAVKDLSLDVQKGEFVTLLGPSGCGKTTTLQMIAGFADVSNGTIHLDGRDITHVKPNDRGLGIVFQSYALFPHMTVHDNVSFGLEIRRVHKTERLERIKNALALVHLDAYADRYPRELSGGQRQRVALARALVIEPQILLLDEPLSNLDAKLREEMQFELRKIQRKVGTTTIMVTHDQSEAMSISDRIVVMQAGRITQIDTPHKLYEQPRSTFISTFVGKANLLSARILKSGNNGRVEISTTTLEVTNLAGDPGQSVRLSLRPEKISLTPAGQGMLDGSVTARYFLGDRWIYYFNTDLGELIVIVSNSDQPPLSEQMRTGLRWEPGSLKTVSEQDQS